MIIIGYKPLITDEDQEPPVTAPKWELEALIAFITLIIIIGGALWIILSKVFP